MYVWMDGTARMWDIRRAGILAQLNQKQTLRRTASAVSALSTSTAPLATAQRSDPTAVQRMLSAASRLSSQSVGTERGRRSTRSVVPFPCDTDRCFPFACCCLMGVGGISLESDGA